MQGEDRDLSFSTPIKHCLEIRGTRDVLAFSVFVNNLSTINNKYKMRCKYIFYELAGGVSCGLPSEDISFLIEEALEMSLEAGVVKTLLLKLTTASRDTTCTGWKIYIIKLQFRRE